MSARWFAGRHRLRFVPRTALAAWLALPSSLAIAAPANPPPPPATAGSDFQDGFRGGLASGWTWIREDRAGWRTTDRGLEVRVQPGNMWGSANNARNVLVRSAPDPAGQEVTVSVRIENRPTEQYEQVDLVWYYSDSHMVKLGQELVDGKLSIVMGREENDRTRTIAIIPLDSATVEVRFIVQDLQVRGEFRTGTAGEWREAGRCEAPVRGAPQVSLQCYQGPAQVERWARLTDFVIRTRALPGSRSTASPAKP